MIGVVVLVQRAACNYVIAKARDCARPWSCYPPHYTHRALDWALELARPC